MRAAIRWQPIIVTAVASACYATVVLAPSLLMLTAAFGADAATWAAIRIAPGGEHRILMLALRSLGVAAAAAALASLLLTPAALLAARRPLAVAALLAVAAGVSLALPGHVHAMAWRALLPDAGVTGAVISLATAYGGWALLAGLGGVLYLDPALADAARLQADEAKVVRRITLPLIRPHLLAGFALVFVFVLTDYGVPALWQVNTYPVEVFALFSALYDERAVALLSLPFVLLAWGALVPLIGAVAVRRHVALGLRSFAARATLGSSGWPRTAIAVAVLPPCFMVIPPLTMLIIGLGPLSALGGAIGSAKDTLLISVTTAAVSATAAVVLFWPLAYVLARTAGRLPLLILMLALLSVAIPGPVVGIGLIGVWNGIDAQGISGGLGGLCVALTARIAPFVLLVLYAAVRQVDVSGETAVLLMSGSWSRRMVRIVLPQARAGLAVAWLGGYVLSLGELGVTLLVVPPGFETLSLRMYNLLHYGALPIVAALSLMLAAVALLPVAVAIIVVRRHQVAVFRAWPKKT